MSYFKKFLQAMLLIAIGISFFWFTQGIKYPSLAWRDSQTAMGVFYIMKGGPWFNYEIPLLGPPWGWPIEFPLFQWLAAIVGKIFQLSADQAGKATSFSFYLLTLWPLKRLSEDLRLGNLFFLISGALYLVSPVIVDTAHLVFIESTCVFFGLWFLVWEVRRQSLPSLSNAARAVVFGSLCALVKITTFPGFAVLAMAIALRNKKIKSTLLVSVVILGVYIFWLIPSGKMRLDNPLLDFFTDSYEQFRWNFGFFKQRFRPDIWNSLLWLRPIDYILGSTFAYLITLFLGGIFCILDKKRTYFFAFMGSFLFVDLVFINLHFIHHYYSYSNALFLILCLALVLDWLVQSTKSFVQILGLLIFMFIVSSSIKTTDARLTDTRFFKVTPASIEICNFVKARTHPKDILVIFGEYLDPTLSHLCERRALMDSRERGIENPLFQGGLARVTEAGFALKVLAVCNHEKTKTIDNQKRVQILGMNPTAAFENQRCAVYLKD